MPRQREQIKASTYARLRGLTDRSVRRMIATRGMPGTKIDGEWHVDPLAADDWIAGHSARAENVTRGRRPAESPRRAPAESPATPAPTGNGQHDPLSVESQVSHLRAVVAAMIAALHAGQCEPRHFTATKQMIGELRALEKHWIAMRQSDDRLMDRTEHEREVLTWSRLVVDEISNSAPLIAEAILGALAAGGIEIPDTRRALQLTTAAAEQQARQLRERIWSLIERNST